MISVGERTGILVLTILIMLLTIPVDAAYAHPTVETSMQTLEPTTNGLTYVYSGVNETLLPTTQYLTHDQDVSVTRFSYSLNAWSADTVPFNGPATREFPFTQYESASWGWLAGGVFLPDFLRITNTTTSVPELSVSQSRQVYPLAVGTLNSVVLDPFKNSLGIFTLTNEEFIHVTIGSRQDDSAAYGAIIGPHYEVLSYVMIGDGDTEVMPVRPVGPGVYMLYLMPMNANTGLLAYEVQIQPVVPDEISVGEVVDGVLPGSELVVDPDDGSVTYEERAPGVHTYKFHCNYTYPGVLQYSMNFPDFEPDGYDLYEPWILMQSDAFVSTPYKVRFQQSFDPLGDAYHYQSFQNEVYYVSVVGMEGVAYTLYHALADAQYLPINTPFFIHNDAYAQRRVYMLDLSADSVMRANYSDELGGGYSWKLWGVDSDMYYRYFQPSPASVFHNADTYYLPAGRYLVEAEAESEDSEGFYQFNIGPVIEGDGGFSVPLGGLLGVRFESVPLGWYNVTLQMTTKDNITAYADYVIFSSTGGIMGEDLGGMGNRQSGVGWEAYGSNVTPFTFDRAVNGSYIVVTSPYNVENNTVGLPGTAYGHYTVDYYIQGHECSDEVYNGSAIVQLDAAPVQHDFPMGEPAEIYETYSLTLNCSEGVWLNVSVYSEDASDWSASVYQVIDGYTQMLGWGNLDDTLVGTPPDECYFQFGAISDTVRIDFTVTRAGLAEGVLSVTVTPIPTNVLQPMPPVESQGGGDGAAAWIAQNMGIVLAGAGAAVAAVVIIVIVAKRRGK